MNTTTQPVQVIYSHGLQGWFVREDGREYQSDYARVSARFGTPFAEACLSIAAAEAAIDAMEAAFGYGQPAELPTLKPITTAVRMPNPEAWKAVAK